MVSKGSESGGRLGMCRRMKMSFTERCSLKELSGGEEGDSGPKNGLSGISSI